MQNYQMLNYRAHENLKVKTNEFTTVGAHVGGTMILPSEIPYAEREFPLFFRKNPETGRFYLSAMLGFKADENLYITDGKWRSDHTPLVFQKGPFLIGFQQIEQDGKIVKAPVIHFDADDERISETEGVAIFDQNGERSKLMEGISQVLMQIHGDMGNGESFVDCLNEYQLIEPVNLDITFDNQEKLNLTGIYTINEDSLSKLQGETLAALNSKGFLRLIFLVVNSMNNVRRLIDIKNSQLSQ